MMNWPKLTIFAFVACGCSELSVDNNTCPDGQAQVLANYSDLLQMDEQIEQKVKAFDQQHHIELSDNQNYMNLLELKSQRDQLVNKLLDFSLDYDHCFFGPPTYNDSGLNRELNEEIKEIKRY